jgi:L-fucose mutarotase
MLIGLDPLLTPDLLHALAAMGHGDTIALVDANYPATRGRRLVVLAGAGAAPVLGAMLSVLPVEAAATMQVIGDAGAVPEVVAELKAVLAARAAPEPTALERHAFYAAAETAYAIVATGERRFYGNILLTKGVVPPADAGVGA